MCVKFHNDATMAENINRREYRKSIIEVFSSQYQKVSSVESSVSSIDNIILNEKLCCVVLFFVAEKYVFKA